MPCIKLTTIIDAPAKLCFDLSRSIDLHKISTSETNEQAIAGKTSGLISDGEYVTWRAKHFGIYQTLTSKITAFHPYNSFTDEMIDGAFKSIKHIHNFEFVDNKTVMTDEFYFESPFGILGKLFNIFALTFYLKKLLIRRNRIIKSYAESNLWKQIINH
jgi:ligand-binding SRPBCC domain-containing protein